MFKKTIPIFIILFILVVGLAACSSTEAQSVEPNVVQQEAEGKPGGPGGQQGGPGGQSMIDLAAAAETLGVTEEALIAAMGEPGQGAPDFAAIAATLGVTEDALMAALGIVEGGMPPGGQPPSGQP